MNINRQFSDNSDKPFENYAEYMDYLYACVNSCMYEYINSLKDVFATGQGDYKNVLYPDIEIASDVCKRGVMKFSMDEGDADAAGDKDDTETDGDSEAADSSVGDSELDELLKNFGNSDIEPEDADGTQDGDEADEAAAEVTLPADAMMQYVIRRAELSGKAGISLPFQEICDKLQCTYFAEFCFVCAIISSTQTSYAGTFQVINENGGISAPTVESAARIYFGKDFNITMAFNEMSKCLEELQPVLDLEINQALPFSTIVTCDKRIIDFLFGSDPEKLDDDYTRFFSLLTNSKEELDPVLANQGVLDAIGISYDEGTRIFSLYGDVGSGRKFFVKQFCRSKQLRSISVNCKKLFSYDFRFVEKALWELRRECMLLNASCCLDDLTFHEEEKEKFFGFLDMAFSQLEEKGILMFLVSMDRIAIKDVTKSDFTELELPTPSNNERDSIWAAFSKTYNLGEDVDLSEMATKFLFTPGKIKSALHLSESLSAMSKEEKISRSSLFKSCYRQMSSELSQKATRIEAKFSFEDIVMNPSQRETLQHAIDQMTFRKEVYENWNYTKKYPYGRGLSVLLFGAPGTGKSMCAQVIAHELNLELYRVDLSKVIDKYVGETEKSISMIFREAKKCNVVLFFDECDTLFAKRSDDGGSNQSSNNNKTALLLQEVEGYDGVSVLATNYKHNIDPAFFRRMKYIVEFQFPDPDTRYMLWKTTIPKTTPLNEDVDLRFIADKFEFVGGNIKNCILNAAFLAAADPEAGGKVGMKHYLNAIKYEFVKTGKVYTKADFEPYSELVGL